MVRARNFRGVRFKLECGHFGDESTSFYRIHPNTLASVKRDAIGSGVFCPICRVHCHPVKFVGTINLDDFGNGNNIR